jgi:hypothetical protein
MAGRARHGVFGLSDLKIISLVAYMSLSPTPHRSRGDGWAYEIVYKTCINSHLSWVIPELSTPLCSQVSASGPTPDRAGLGRVPGLLYLAAPVAFNASISKPIRPSFSENTPIGIDSVTKHSVLLMAAVPRSRGWWLDSGRLWLAAWPLTCFGRRSRHVSLPGIAPNFYIHPGSIPSTAHRRNNEVPAGWVIAQGG